MTDETNQAPVDETDAVDDETDQDRDADEKHNLSFQQAVIDSITLSADQKLLTHALALRELDDECAWSVGGLADDTGLPPDAVINAAHRLAELGIVRLRWRDDQTGRPVVAEIDMDDAYTVLDRLVRRAITTDDKVRTTLGTACTALAWHPAARESFRLNARGEVEFRGVPIDGPRVLRIAVWLERAFGVEWKVRTVRRAIEVVARWPDMAAPIL